MRATKVAQVVGSRVRIKEIPTEALTIVGWIAKADKRREKIRWLFHVVIAWRTLVPNEVWESVPPDVKARKTVIVRKTAVGTEPMRETERRKGIVIGTEIGIETEIGTATVTGIVVMTRIARETGKIGRALLLAVRSGPVQ
jgi:hypothetical protein